MLGGGLTAAVVAVVIAGQGVAAGISAPGCCAPAAAAPRATDCGPAFCCSAAVQGRRHDTRGLTEVAHHPTGPVLTPAAPAHPDAGAAAYPWERPATAALRPHFVLRC